MATGYYRGGGGARDHADEPDDFDEYDPTPYGGGYDLFITFCRPLPPSDETCYPCSAPSTSYDAPHYSADEPSPYAHHSKPQPAYGFRPQHEQQQQPSYASSGYRPQHEQQQSYGSSGYGAKPQPAYGFRPQAEEEITYGSGYGSGYGGGGRKQQEEESYGSGYGRKPQVEES